MEKSGGQYHILVIVADGQVTFTHSLSNTQAKAQTHSFSWPPKHYLFALRLQEVSTQVMGNSAHKRTKQLILLYMQGISTSTTF